MGVKWKHSNRIDKKCDHKVKYKNKKFPSLI